MKKILQLLLFLFLLSSTSFAQTVLFSDDFDSYTTSQKLAEQSSAPEWTTWSGTTGASEDAAISTEQAFSGSNSAKVVTDNDLVLDLGGKTTGRFQVKFQLFVSDGKSCFVGFMQDFAGSDTKFGLTLYFQADTGMLNAGGKTYEFDYSYDNWMLINTIVDLDDDFATLYIDGTEIASWVWSKGSEGGGTMKKLDAIDFWGYNESTGCQYYIDNVEYNQLTTLDTPTSLSSSLINRIVTLNWNAPASGSPIEYAVIRNGSVIGKTASLTYDDTTLIYPMIYTYTVKAHSVDLGYSASSNETTETLTGNTAQRKVLIEHHTSADCGPCAQQNPILDALINEGDNLSKVAHVAYHTSWPSPGTDPMYLFNNSNGLGNARVSYYGVSSVPNAIVAGNQFQGSPANITQELIDAEYALPGLFNITSSITIDENDSIFIEIDYTSLANFVSGNLTVYVVLIEDMEYSSQAGTNGEKVFPDVMRYMYPDKNGTDIDLPQIDDEINLHFKGKLDTEIGEHLQLVTFVQNDLDNEIYMVYQVDEDFTSPVISISPQDGSTNIDQTVNVEVAFSDSIRMIDDSEITDPSSIIVFKKDDQNGADVAVVATINATKDKITLDPVNDLDPVQLYYIAIEAGVIENNYDVLNFANNASFTTKTSVGIGNIYDNQILSTYPNPCADKLNIEFNRDNITSVKIRIYNESGQLIKLIDKGDIPSGKQLVELDLSRINNGLYFVNITFDSESITRKIQILK
jgi:hypothetical protein